MDVVALVVGLVAVFVALVAGSRAAKLARETAKARQDIEQVRKAGSEMWEQVVLFREELKALRSPAVAPGADVSAPTSASPPPPVPSAEASVEPPPAEVVPVVEASSVGVVPVVEAPSVRPPPVTIDWEQWLGVRGAAVVGGVALALAGLLFFKFSVDHGLLSPTLRVTLGLVAGVSCVVGSQRLVDRYRITADALAGGGLVVLYASVWAARALYALIGTAPAFALMALFTGLASLLSVRRGSVLIRGPRARGGLRDPAAGLVASRQPSRLVRVHPRPRLRLPLHRAPASMAPGHMGAPRGDVLARGALDRRPDGPRRARAGARDTVLAVRSTAATLGAFGRNPSFRPMTRLSASFGLQDIALWAALIAATLVLGGLTLRLAREPNPPREARPQDDE
jgi:hypothetical protein